MYAVIFSSKRTFSDDGYDALAREMVERASVMPGFVRMESVRDNAGQGLTVSYWESEDAISAWKADAAHRIAQARGKAGLYDSYSVVVAKVERSYTGPARPSDTDKALA